jgi:hypothetical protein
MNARMLASSRQSVQVQNVLAPSFSSTTRKFPGVALACRDERSAYQINPGTNRQERK